MAERFAWPPSKCCRLKAALGRVPLDLVKRLPAQHPPRVPYACVWIEQFPMFEKDPETKIIVMIGEIGGDAEERAADYIKANVSKPVVGYVAGFTAPEGKTMGHAGAIVSGSSGTADAKKEALEAAGVKVGKTPSETAALARQILESR